MDEPPRGEIVPLPKPDPLTIIADAIKSGMDPEKLGKLMDLSERWQKDRAAEAFANAITAFQRECPQIEKRRNVEGKYNYAPYDDVMKVAQPIMVRHGIVATFDTTATETGIIITCRIRVGTHCEETRLAVPTPAGNKLVNAAQLMGQNVQYAKRYALCMALNIVTCAEDNDAADVLDTLIFDECRELAELIEKKGADRVLFLNYASKVSGFVVDELEKIPRKAFATLRTALLNKKPNGGGK